MGEEEQRFVLPPGCRFYPSDEQLVTYYLTSKNSNNDGMNRVINEVDLYDYNPFDLPDAASFRYGRGGRRRHWYCYVRVLSGKGLRRRRRGRRRPAGNGYWRRTGSARYVVSGGGSGTVVVGTRRSFVFYLGDHGKTDWVMYEYALIDHPLNHMASFVLCRVFVKTHCAIDKAEQMLSSCEEESVATVRHIGVQHDGSVASVVAEAKKHQENSIKHRDELSDNQTTNEPIAEQMKSAGNFSGVAGDLRAEMAVVEGDYIELDDLLCPLLGMTDSI